MSVAAPLVLREGDRSRLEALTRSSSVRAGLARGRGSCCWPPRGCRTRRSRGGPGRVRPTVVDWRARYDAGGIARLGRSAAQRAAARDRRDRRRGRDAGRGRPPAGASGGDALVGPAAGRRAGDLLRHGGADLAQVEPAAVAVETFKFSTDPELDAKIRDVVGLYLNPPEKAVVLCVDEKSQIQALDRTAPILPILPGLPGETDPRLRPPRHHHPVRRAGGRHRPGRAGVPTRATATRSSCGSSNRSPRPTRASSCTWSATTTPPTNTRP